LDAVTLGNWITALQDPSIESLEKAFREYKAERYPVVMAAYNNGRLLSKVNAKVSNMMSSLLLTALSSLALLLTFCSLL